MAQDLNQDKQDKLKIAVIAVHGVAEQSPYDSARAITNLLLNHNRSENQVQYTPFYEYPLRVAVRPLRGVDKAEYDDLEQSRQKFLLDERGTYTSKCLKKARFALENYQDAHQADERLEKRSHYFMRQQLKEYKGEDVRSTYESVRLEGRRLGDGNEPRPDVHVYEMYWADLSRLGTGFVRIFSEFYQLLFHLSSLGRDVVDRARIEYQDAFGRKDPWWTLYSEVQAWAGRMLSVFIPILNLYLLLTVLITLPGNIPSQYQPIIVWGSLGLLGIAAIGYWLPWRKPKTPFPIWAVLPVLLAIGAIAVGAIVGFGYRYETLDENFNPSMQLSYYRILAFEWCALSAAIMWFLMRRYAIRRLGVDVIAAYIGVVLAVIITGRVLSAQNSHVGITDAAFKTLEIIYFFLALGWFVFSVLQFAAALLGWIAVRKTAAKGNEELHERVKRAAWMGRVTLAIPSALFLVVTMALWIGLERAGSRLLPNEKFYTPLFLSIDQSQAPFSGSDFVHGLIILAASPFFIVLLCCILAGAIVAVWSLFPVALAEVFPPKSDEQSSQQYGQWLTKGFDLMETWGSSFLFLAMAIVFPIGWISAIWKPQLAAEVNEAILGIFATVLVASTTGLLAFRGRLDKLSLGFRSVLDIVLDVDSYLRLHPVADNPRARICARYVSLLRYLCKWSDPEDNGGYDALVIVAHSQGTVITADLLRFLKYQRDERQWHDEGEPCTPIDPGLDKLWCGDLPIYFFTMGCPLRQLYALGFPHLYNWARHYDKTPWQRQPHKPQYIDEKQKPDPKKLLGVKRWVNTFRSGDYVGRYLWRSDVCDYQWVRPAAKGEEDSSWTSDRDRPVYVSEDNNFTRREFCLGGGAHTHYWDGISDEVATEIDILIREACCEALKNSEG